MLVLKLWEWFVVLDDQWKRHVCSQPTMGILGSPSPYIFLIVFRLAWALSTIKPLKLTFDTPSSTMTTFKFLHKRVCVVPSLDCMSQHTIVNTLYYLLSYKWSSPSNIWCDQALSTNSPCFFRFAYTLQDPHHSLEGSHTFWRQTLELVIMDSNVPSVLHYYPLQTNCFEPDTKLQQFGKVRVLNLFISTSNDESTKWWSSPFDGKLRR